MLSFIVYMLALIGALFVLFVVGLFAWAVRESEAESIQFRRNRELIERRLAAAREEALKSAVREILAKRQDAEPKVH